jgi:hypothetical protein|tara:strand:+ start:651 stop:884 length:234 start_codon:yes stop_codon:yes gene_type:complete
MRAVVIVGAGGAKMIKIVLETGYDQHYEKATPNGTHKGSVTYEEVELTEEQAQKLLQGFLNRLDQGSAIQFINKYKK